MAPSLGFQLRCPYRIKFVSLRAIRHLLLYPDKGSPQWGRTGGQFLTCIHHPAPMSICNSSLLQVPFLNLMANIVERAGWVQVRVGGNSQETAQLVPSLPNGTMLAKDTSNTSGPTNTPPLQYTTDLLYLMANISKLTNTHWYLGSILHVIYHHL